MTLAIISERVVPSVRLATDGYSAQKTSVQRRIQRRMIVQSIEPSFYAFLLVKSKYNAP